MARAVAVVAVVEGVQSLWLATAAMVLSPQEAVEEAVERIPSAMASAAMAATAVMASSTFTRSTKSNRMARYAVIKEGYVLNVVEWDPVAAPDWTYPFTHDSVVLDANGNAGIGDWYEAAEGIFYRPINAQPPDWPQELLP
jgi:hypothetical protein